MALKNLNMRNIKHMEQKNVKGMEGIEICLDLEEQIGISSNIFRHSYDKGMNTGHKATTHAIFTGIYTSQSGYLSGLRIPERLEAIY